MLLGASDGHFLDQYGATPHSATQILIVTDCGNSLIQLPQVSRDGNFMYSELNFAIFYPMSNRTA